MFKSDEKVVCINNKDSYGNILLENKFYTIEKVANNRDSVWIKFYDTNFFWDSKRFIPLVEYRRLKIENIKKRI